MVQIELHTPGLIELVFGGGIVSISLWALLFTCLWSVVLVAVVGPIGAAEACTGLLEVEVRAAAWLCLNAVLLPCGCACIDIRALFPLSIRAGLLICLWCGLLIAAQAVLVWCLRRPVPRPTWPSVTDGLVVVANVSISLLGLLAVIYWPRG